MILALALLTFSTACSEEFGKYEARLLSVEEQLQKLEKFSRTLQAPRAAFGSHFLGEDLFAITSEKEHSSSIQTLDLFVARLPMRQVEKKPASKNYRRQQTHLLVTTDDKGSVQVWNMDQDLLAELDTKSNQPFTTSQVHGGNQNILLFGLASGEVKIYSLAVWRTNKIDEMIQIGMVSHMTIPFQNDPKENPHEEESEVQDKENCESAPSVTSIGVYIRRSHEKFLVGYDNGEIHSFDDAGEWKRKWTSGNATIHKIVVGPKAESLVLTESGFTVIDSHKLKSTTAFCPSPDGITFEDAVIDKKFPDIFYVSTNNGTIYAYRRRKKLCRVLKQIDGEVSLSHVASISGHLIIGSAKEFTAYNVTSRRLKNMQKQAFRQEFVLAEGSSDSIIGLHSAVDALGVAAIALRRGRTVTTWEGFVELPNYSLGGGGGSFDLLHFLTGVGRIPIFILIVACVFGWQWYNRKNRARAFEDSKRNRLDPMQFSDFQPSGPRQPMHIGKNIEGISQRTAHLDSEIQKLQNMMAQKRKKTGASAKPYKKVSKSDAKKPLKKPTTPEEAIAAAKSASTASKAPTLATSASKTEPSASAKADGTSI